jgi:hypothetical protein
MKKFSKDKVVKTKSKLLPKTGKISKLLIAEKELLTGRMVEIDNTLALLKDNPQLETVAEILLKPLEIEQ